MLELSLILSYETVYKFVHSAVGKQKHSSERSTHESSHFCVKLFETIGLYEILVVGSTISHTFNLHILLIFRRSLVGSVLAY